MNLAVCLGSLLVLALGAETVIRAVRGDAGEPRKKFPQGLYCRRHPLFGWLGVPGASGRVTWTAQDMDDMRVVINEDGFWDGTHRRGKPAGVKRLLFLGDSFTIGYGVQPENRFSNVIAGRMASNCEVLNMGMWGYSTDQELLLFTEKGLPYDPDVVVVSMFLDDLYCTNLFSVNEGRYMKPRFSVSNDEKLELGNTPVPSNGGPSALVNTVRSRISQLRNRMALGREFTQIGWFSVFDKAYVKEGGYYLSLRIINEMHAIAKSHGKGFLLVLIPYRDQLVESDILAGGGAYAGIPPHRLDLRLPQKVVTRYCVAMDIPVLDLLPVFEHYEGVGKLFFDTDLHWTKQGHQLAAGAIHERLGTMGLL